MRGLRFNNSEETFEAYKYHVSSVLLTEWHTFLYDWFIRIQKCIDAAGECFEKQYNIYKNILNIYKNILKKIVIYVHQKRDIDLLTENYIECCFEIILKFAVNS